MKIKHKIMASAIAFAVGLSTASAGTANPWWSVDFESYSANAAISGITEASEGAWSGDLNSLSVSLATAGLGAAVAPAGPNGKIGKIDTQGGSLVWTPATPAPAGTTVLIDADVYMVGSDAAPAASSGTVQTEVFLTNGLASSSLCAHINSGWVNLSHPSVTIQDKTWIRLRIEIDYAPATPTVSFFVNNYLMVNGATEKFNVMALGAGQDTVNSVSFMGTGYIDNFVGQTLTPTVAALSNGAGTATSIVEAGNVVTATFATSNNGQDVRYIKMTGPSGYVRTARTTDGVEAFSTTGLPPGTYTITAYYGANAPTLTTGLAAPAATTVGVNKAAEVVEVSGAKKLSVTVVPRSGLYYTLFVGSTPSLLTAGANSVLAGPADQDAGFMKMNMPAPATANGVNIIKIYASDEPYTQGNNAP